MSYQGLDGVYYGSHEAMKAADARFHEKHAREQIKVVKKQGQQQLYEQRRHNEQQMAELKQQNERMIEEQKVIANQQIIEQRRAVEAQRQIEAERQRHAEKMRMLSWFDAAGINYAVYENYSQYLFAPESPEHYPPELIALNNTYNELSAKYTDASSISVKVNNYNTAMQALDSVPLRGKHNVNPVSTDGGDSLINDVNKFIIWKPIRKWIGVLIYYAVLIVVMMIMGQVPVGVHRQSLGNFLMPLFNFLGFTPIIVLPVTAIIRRTRRRNTKRALLNILRDAVYTLFQQVNQLMGMNTPDIDYAINALSEQIHLTENEIEGMAMNLKCALVKRKWEHFHEFRLNNYNPTIEKLLLDMNIPAQLERYGVRFISVSKNTAKNSNDDIQDYISYFQEVTA